MSLGLTDIPRNLKISKHTGETNHLQYFDNALKQWSPPCGPCGLCELFPNVCISLIVFLTIPATLASAERFFRKLKLVKNCMRSAMPQTRFELPTMSLGFKSQSVGVRANLCDEGAKHLAFLCLLDILFLI